MITAHRIRDYHQLIEACQLTEHSFVALLADKQALEEKEERRRLGKLKKKGWRQERKTNGHLLRPYRLKYKNCGGFHNGECVKGKGVCFICQKPGHIAWRCPDKDKRKDGQVGAPVRCRVYTVDAKEADQSENLVQGMRLIHNQPVHILFDLGAKHSFISLVCSTDATAH
jgi:uncharacterized Fe-S cluster protein YjdI